MDNNFDVQIQTLSDEDMSALMGDVPAKAAITDDLIIGASSDDNSQTEGKKSSSKKPKKVESDQDDKDENDDNKEVVHDIDSHVEQLAEAGSEDGTTDQESTSVDILKAMGQGLIERGVWQDFEGSEDFEWTEESYGQLAQIQAQWNAENMFNEMVDETGDFGKTVFSHIKNGGDPNEIITLFKESKRIDNFDISNQDGQENIVKEYYSKLGWSEGKVKNFIKSLVDAGTLEDEAKDSKDLLGEAFNKEIELTKKQQEDYIAEQKRLEQEFSTTMTNAVKVRKDLNDKDKRSLLDSVLKYDQKLPNGRVVNQFTIDFMKIQSDPQKYIDLIAFVRNPDKYIEKIGKEKEDVVTKKTWNFIKGGGSLSRNTGTQSGKGSPKGSNLKIDYKNINL